MTVQANSFLRGPAVPLLLAAILAPCLAADKLAEDPPLVAKPKDGDITGTIAPAGKVSANSVTAVSRVTGKTYTPASFDKATGKFTFKNMPGDAAYDIVINTSDGRQIEGIDLDFADSRLLALAAQRRKDLGLPPEEPHEFGQQDVDALMNYVTKLEDFMEQRRVLYIQPHGPRATMLIELMRTREFYSSAGKIVWRVELWYFEYQHGGWERLPNQERVLQRERIDPDAWKKIDREYYPELTARIAADGTLKASSGTVKAADGKSTEIKFNIPDKPDPSRGRPAGTEPNIPASPHVIGLEGEVTTSRPSTQP
ncbi:MAG: hypothetical protein ACE15C_00475 [Phycisphaerae bacterium]